jgi:hypothetical protein
MIRAGGCQCGAVRFRVEGDIGRAGLCHCRMCQKAFAGPFAALVTVRLDQLAWPRGERRRFKSSNRAWRGFCADCGTPLTYETAGDTLELAVCAFDDPAAIPVGAQLRLDHALPWVETIADIPKVNPALTARRDDGVVSYQQPDRD